jgi:hypothetical protein
MLALSEDCRAIGCLASVQRLLQHMRRLRQF